MRTLTQDQRAAPLRDGMSSTAWTRVRVRFSLDA